MIALLVAAAFLPGFNRTPSLEPAASFVAGKPVAVYCAKSTPAWQAFLAENYPAGTVADGSSVPGSSTMRLSFAACSYLRPATRAALAPTIGLAASTLTLTHEAIHLSGVKDEAVTDCDAVHRMP